MTDILERAIEAQRGQAHGTYVQMRLDFLQDMIAEIERLRALLPASTIKDITAKLEIHK